MNDRKLAKFITEHLDESANKLSYKAQHRLEVARKTAVKEAFSTAAQSARASSIQSNSSATLTLSNIGEQMPGGRFNLILNWLPLLVLVIGLFFGMQNNIEAESEALASEDVMLLTDELPPEAYADHGFGVFIKNTRDTADAISGNP
jgi:ATP-dependent Zn protease